MPFRIRWFFVQLHFVEYIFQNFKLALISLAIPLGNVLIALLIKWFAWIFFKHVKHQFPYPRRRERTMMERLETLFPAMKRTLIQNRSFRLQVRFCKKHRTKHQNIYHSTLWDFFFTDVWGGGIYLCTPGISNYLPFL